MNKDLGVGPLDVALTLNVHLLHDEGQEGNTFQTSHVR